MKSRRDLKQERKQDQKLKKVSRVVMQTVQESSEQDSGYDSWTGEPDSSKLKTASSPSKKESSVRKVTFDRRKCEL